MTSHFTTLIERLLFEAEGDSLDFKQAQYRFSGASDSEKAELLKDILAFANSWKRADAYILIGVQEVKGGRGVVTGVSEHLDDASLQQFVNAKTQRPVQFSYHALEFEGKQVALLHIPVQTRPLYLKSGFAQLMVNAVYVRRGSSTAVAAPDEVSKMGRAEQSYGRPDLEVFFHDASSRERIAPSLTSINLLVPERASLPNYLPSNVGPFATRGIYRHTNRNYYRELAHYTRVRLLVRPLYLAVENSGGETALDVRVLLKVPGASSGVLALDEDSFPDVPVAERDILVSGVPNIRVGACPISVTKVGDFWEVEAHFAKVQPRATEWLQEPFYLGADSSQNLSVPVTVFADNLPHPHQQSLAIPIAAKVESANLNRIEELETERFIASEEYRRITEELDDAG